MIPLSAHSRTAVSACLALVLALTAGTSAFANTLSDKRAQAAAAQAQITALINRQEIASQNFDAARQRYEDLSAKVASAQQQVEKLQANTLSLQDALGNQADAMYRDDGTLGLVAALLSARSLEDFNSTLELIQRVGEQNAAMVSQLKANEQATAAEERRLASAQADAAVQQAAMAADEAAVNARLADQKKLLATLSSEIKTILAQQAAAAAAAARARYLALLRRHGGGGPAFDPGGNPPTSSKGAAAVWWAEKALGKPYEWAAAGPNSFDCSGLMLWAYAHVGISLPHYSGAQIGVGARVGRANLEPGDLVFFGSPIHHVGMYIGNGQFIEAPYTGADVRISVLGDRGDYAGACRP